MRYIFLFLFVFLAGCFEDGNNPLTSSTTKKTISGKLNLTNAGVDPSAVRVSCAGIVTTPTNDGSWTISKNVVAGRVASSSSDTVKIIIGNDTLKEIPVISWDTILPTNYIVQRNISVQLFKALLNDTVEAVFWDNDSVAHVVTLGQATKNMFSGFIYTAYDDIAYRNNSSLYGLFVRVKNDGVTRFSDIVNVTAKTGDLDFDSTQVPKKKESVRYMYSITPNDSNINNYKDTIFGTMVVDTIFDTADYDSFCHYAKGDTAIIGDTNIQYTDANVFRDIDSYLKNSISHRFVVKNQDVPATIMYRYVDKYGQEQYSYYTEKTFNVKDLMTFKVINPEHNTKFILIREIKRIRYLY
jgi:hypothetical protein